MRVHDLQGDALDLATTITAAFAPPPDQSPSAWAEANLVLTSDFASEPGQYNLDRTPWCRAPLDDAADATVDTVIITGSSQCGKTQLSLAVVAYFAGVLPCPIMHIVPTDGLSGTFAARFDSMIAASAALRDRFVKPRRTRAVANKSVKTFDGGVLILASAASPTDLSSRPIKPVRRWRPAGVETLCGERRVHQPHVRLLQRLRLRSEAAHRPQGLSIQCSVLGFHIPPHRDHKKQPTDGADGAQLRQIRGCRESPHHRERGNVSGWPQIFAGLFLTESFRIRTAVKQMNAAQLRAQHLSRVR